MTIELIKPKGRNFTPAGVMLEYAKTHNIPTLWDKYGALALDLGFAARYDHWDITDNHDGTESVKIYLTV